MFDVKILGKLPKDATTEQLEKLDEMIQTLFEKSDIAFLDRTEENINLVSPCKQEKIIKLYNHLKWNKNLEFSFLILYKNDKSSILELNCYIFKNKERLQWSTKRFIDYINNVMLEAYLLLEHIFPGSFICYLDFENTYWANLSQWDYKKDHAFNRTVHALFALQNLFPEESFDHIISFRMSPDLWTMLVNHTDSKVDASFAYQRSCFYKDPVIMAEQMLTIIQEFIETESDQKNGYVSRLDLMYFKYKFHIYNDFYMLDELWEKRNDRHEMNRYDARFEQDLKTYPGMFFFIWCVMQELCRKFHSLKTEQDILEALQSLNKLRNAERENSEWETYQLPLNVFWNLCHIDMEVLYSVISHISDRTKEEIYTLAKNEISEKAEKMRSIWQSQNRKRIEDFIIDRYKNYIDLNEVDSFGVNGYINADLKKKYCKAYFREQDFLAESRFPLFLENACEIELSVRRDILLQTLQKMKADELYFSELVFRELVQSVLYNDAVFAVILLLNDEHIEVSVKEKWLYLLEWEDLRKVRKDFLDF